MEEPTPLDTVRTKFELLRPLMDERMRRQWAASEALSLRRGGVTVVATGSTHEENPRFYAIPII